MLTIHRRHARNCKKRKYPTVELDHCNCPLMLMGKDGHGVYHNREALHTRDKYTAAQVAREIEEGRLVKPRATAEEWTLEKALGRYRDMLVEQKGLKESTIRNNKLCHKSLLSYADRKGIKYLREITPTDLSNWVKELLPLATSTRVMRIGMMKRMLDLAWKMKWIPEDPSIHLMSPKQNREGKTKPFDLQSELPRIMKAIPIWDSGFMFIRKTSRNIWSRNPETAAAFMYVLRFTGMRASDAFMFNPTQLERRVINGQEMYCYFAKKQKKTDHPVFLPMFPEDAEPILKAKWLSDQWAFWDGKTELHDWNNKFQNVVFPILERVSGVTNIHPHRFRDTFATDLLSKGVDIRSVSRLLGHKSVATTLQYYEHYVLEDQDRLIAKVQGSAHGGAHGAGEVIQFPHGNRNTGTGGSLRGR
jgi:integrase/recombinase XerD